MWAPGPIGDMRHLRSRRCAGIRHHARPSALPVFATGDLVILRLLLLINPIVLNPIFCHWC
eukprot:4733449-Heterocapsa_arctica.AAC.1